jgi:hypothetical protein
MQFQNQTNLYNILLSEDMKETTEQDSTEVSGFYFYLLRLIALNYKGKYKNKITAKYMTMFHLQQNFQETNKKNQQCTTKITK